MKTAWVVFLRYTVLLLLGTNLLSPGLTFFQNVEKKHCVCKVSAGLLQFIVSNSNSQNVGVTTVKTSSLVAPYQHTVC